MCIYLFLNKIKVDQSMKETCKVLLPQELPNLEYHKINIIFTNSDFVLLYNIFCVIVYTLLQKCPVDINFNITNKCYFRIIFAL